MGTNDEDKKKIQQKLYDLMDEYVVMAKKVGALSSMDQMLTGMNLPYSVEVMAMSLPSKFRVPHIDLNDKSKDPLEHLDTFKAHMTLHRFP